MKESPPEAARRLQPRDYQISELILTLPQVMLRPSGDGLKPAPRAVVSIGVARSGHYLSVGHLSKNPGFWANAYAAGPPSAQLAEVQYRCDPTCRLALLPPMQYIALAAATFAGTAVDVAVLPRPLVYQVRPTAERTTYVRSKLMIFHKTLYGHWHSQSPTGADGQYSNQSTCTLTKLNSLDPGFYVGIFLPTDHAVTAVKTEGSRLYQCPVRQPARQGLHVQFTDKANPV